jgi:hypothetical protein
MKNIVPPFFSNKLRYNNCYPIVGLTGFILNCINKFGQWIYDTPVVRVQCHQSNIRLPFLPFFFKHFFVFSFKSNVNCNNLWGWKRFCIVYRIFYYCSGPYATDDKASDERMANAFVLLSFCSLILLILRVFQLKAFLSKKSPIFPQKNMYSYITR